jgi:hypothetical protein
MSREVQISAASSAPALAAPQLLKRSSIFTNHHESPDLTI